MARGPGVEARLYVLRRAGPEDAPARERGRVADRPNWGRTPSGSRSSPRSSTAWSWHQRARRHPRYMADPARAASLYVRTAWTRTRCPPP